MRRLLAWFIIFTLISGCFPGLAEAEGETPVAESGRQMVAEISVKQFATGTATVNLLLADGVNGTDPDIRFFPYDAETGLYATGEGERAGDRAEVSIPEGQDQVLTVSLNTPGKYSLCGIPFYVLSPDAEALSALTEEILDAVDKADAKTQKATAEKLYAWLLKRVKNTIPEDREDLREACADPLNCLLTGYALPEAYAPLYQLLLRCAGIRSVPVTGTLSDAEHAWIMCRLDDEWAYADPAADDVKDRGGKKYFAPEEKQFRKDHTLTEATERFVNERILGTTLDAFLSGDREIVDELLGKDNMLDAREIIYTFEGKQYGLCPTEPVTIRVYSDYLSEWPGDPATRVRGFFGTYHAWNGEYQRFLQGGGLCDTMPENAFEVLECAEDYSSFTVRFLKPGAYTLNGSGAWFFAMDPDDEVQVSAAAKLDEALETCKRDTETETAKALHDWERKQVSYDYERYKLIKTGQDLGYDDASQCPIHGVVAGKLVCGGYTHLYNLLLNSAGIRSFEVIGRRSTSADLEHAWNMHLLDGVWSYTDVTWDDELNSNKYFAKDYNTFMRDHIPADTGKDFMDAWGRNRIYDGQLLRFFRDWGARDIVPEVLKALPATADGCGFPASVPDFWKIRLTLEDGNYVLQNPGRNVTCFQFLALDKYGGKPDGGGGYNPEGMRRFPYTFYLSSDEHPTIFRLTLQDYQEDMRPGNKAGIRQIAEWVQESTEILYSEYNYEVPMKQNEIRGFGTGSCHIFTYDMNMCRISRTWHLVSETVTLDITVYFDSEGKTVRYRISRTPAGGDPVTWEAEADGTITYLSCIQDRELWTLADMTDKYPNELYKTFRKKVWNRYKDIISKDNPPAEGVRLYALSQNAQELYGGRVATATTDPLFLWTEQGRLEFNPDARDLNGREILWNGFDPDLSVCERLQIAN